MPELPEVETVKTGLQKSTANASIEHVWMSPKKLRFPLSLQKFKTLLDRPILSVQRRAKYLLFDLGDFILLNHLGMTGTWRELKNISRNTGKNAYADSKPHDHVKLHLSNNKILMFNDIRRFGFFSLSPKKDIGKNIFLKNLGPEPLTQDFTAEYLLQKAFKKQAPLKTFIMDQKIVVGVGNIYASEALFLSKIRPDRASGKLKEQEAEVLVQNIQSVLHKAIQAGGSYLRNFQALEGTASFQNHFQVYDKAETACVICKSPIQKIIQAGRSTFFCKKCQK